MITWLSKQYFNQIYIHIYSKYQKLWCMHGKQIIPYLKWEKTEVFYTLGFLPRFWNICLNFASYTSLIWKPEIYNALKSKSLYYRVKIFFRLKISSHTKSGILIKPSHSLQGSVIHSFAISYCHKIYRHICSHMHTHNKWYQPSLGDGVKGNFIFIIPLYIYKIHQILAGMCAWFCTCHRELWKKYLNTDSFGLCFQGGDPGNPSKFHYGGLKSTNTRPC